MCRSKRGRRAWRRLAGQGGCGQLDVAVDHDEARHLERCACCSASLSQPHGEALIGSFEDYGIPSRDKVLGIDFFAGFDSTANSDAGYANKSNDGDLVSRTVITLRGCGRRLGKWHVGVR